MEWSSLLLASIFIPLAGAVIVSLLSGTGERAARAIALIATVATLICVVMLTKEFVQQSDPSAPFAQTDGNWFGDAAGMNIHFRVALDGLGIWMYGLCGLLFVTCVLVSWEAINNRPALFYAMLLLLECGCLGVFTARDIILFYVFFEFTLIPLFFLIGIWGSEQRRYAAIKFFLFTLAGSVLTFLGLIAIVWFVYSANGTLTFSIAELSQQLQRTPIEFHWQIVIFVGLFAGFSIKVPLFPLHTWLPLAHVQAPTAGSVILAGILLKIGTYGFVRFSLPMLPDATAACMPWILCLSVAGIIYGALVALAQRDIKSLIAYSSVSHLGYCMLGLFALNPLGLNGGVLQMVNHGISTGALFAIVGMIYERYRTREINQLSGLARRMPVLAFFMILFTMSSIGLPGLNGFAGEFLILIGMFQRAWSGAPEGYSVGFLVIAVLAVSGVVLGAWYMLWLVQRVFFGPLREPRMERDRESLSDLKPREIAALTPLAVFVIWIGLHPGFFIDRIEPSLKYVSISAQQAIEAHYGGPELRVDRINELEMDLLSRVD